MRLIVRYAALTDPGRACPTNEDNWTADTEHGLFIVAGGMGGRFGGAVASKAVVPSLERVRQCNCKPANGFSTARSPR
jgi:serine/threonine protein phosphatase PrpC